MFENKINTDPKSFNEEIYNKQIKLNSQLTSKRAEVLVLSIFVVLMFSFVLFIIKLLR